MSLWFDLELNSILNKIAHMPCNENTYIEVYRYSSAEHRGVIPRRDLISEIKSVSDRRLI